MLQLDSRPGELWPAPAAAIGTRATAATRFVPLWRGGDVRLGAYAAEAELQRACQISEAAYGLLDGTSAGVVGGLRKGPTRLLLCICRVIDKALFQVHSSPAAEGGDGEEDAEDGQEDAEAGRAQAVHKAVVDATESGVHSELAQFLRSVLPGLLLQAPALPCRPYWMSPRSLDPPMEAACKQYAVNWAQLNKLLLVERLDTCVQLLQGHACLRTGCPYPAGTQGAQASRAALRALQL